MKREVTLRFISTPHALGLMGAAFIFFVVGIIYGLGQVYIMFGVVAALPLACYLVGRSTLRGLTVQRRMPGQAVENEDVRVQLRVSNPGRVGRFLFRVEDQLPEWLASDRAGGVVHHLPSGEQTALTYTVHPLKRGVHKLGPIWLATTDAAGLFRFRRRAGEAAELVVHPAPAPVPNLRLGGDPAMGAHQPTRRPAQDGADFHSVREYVPGDDLRRIHWKSTARLGVFNVLEFEQSLSSGVTLILDLNADGDVGEGRRNTVEYAVKLAAGVVQQSLARGSVCHLVAQGREDRSVRVARGRADAAAAMDALARVQADGTRPVSELTADLTRRLPHGSVVAVITAVPDPALARVAARLRQRGTPLTVILLRGDSFAPTGPAQAAYEAAARALARAGAEVQQVYAFDARFEAGHEH